MRDYIKTEEYFQDYIHQQNNRIENFLFNMEHLKIEEPRLTLIKQKITSLKFSVFEAKYSLGYELHELRDEFMSNVLESVSYWGSTTGYVDILHTLSLSVLLEIDEVEWKGVADAIYLYGRNDWLLGFLCSSRDHRKEYLAWDVFMKTPYEMLREIIEKSSRKAEDIKTYLQKKWYRAHSFLPWYDIHKSQHNLYSGYWSYESAAVVKVLGIDDSCLQNVQYYPYDLAHFKK